MLSWAIRRRSEVQRWPAVPAAANSAERTARSSRALGATIIALLPPSSSSERPSRAATVVATARPIRTEPVAEINGSSGACANASPTAPSPATRQSSASGASGMSAAARSASAWQAIAQSGAFSDGFQSTGSPQTSASMAFQAQTALGKLNAVITAIGPRGCHCSVRRWRDRSLAIVSP